MFSNQQNDLNAMNQYNRQIKKQESEQNLFEFQDFNYESTFQDESHFDSNKSSQKKPYYQQSSISDCLNESTQIENHSSTRLQPEFQQIQDYGFSFPEGIVFDSLSENYQSDKQSGDDESEESSSNNSLVLSNKKKNLDRNLKKMNFETFFKQNMIPEKLINSNRKFYLFIDQMIDLDYFRNLKNPNNFADENQAIQLQKGFRITNSVIHRVDNKFIEIESELMDPQPQSIDYIIQIMKSLGDRDLIKYINCLQEFQTNIDFCKKLLKNQSIDPQFINNRLERQQAGNEEYKRVTAGLDPNKLLFYQRYSINYDKCIYQTTRAGYSPALYELLDNGSYQFKDNLLKNGFHDPMSQLFRLGECFYRTCYFMSALPKDFDYNLEKLAELDLITCDNFRFPVTMELHHFYLEQQFDKDNGLDLKFCDLLAVYEFNFKDKEALAKLQEIRKEQIDSEYKLETLQGNIDWDQFDYVQTQFFNQYYSEQVDNLLKKGNKWYKRCGFTEIPTKKQKK